MFRKVSAVVIAAAILVSAGVAVGTQLAEQPEQSSSSSQDPTGPVYRCIHDWWNDPADNVPVCINFEQNRQTGEAVPVYLTPGETLDD